MRYKAKAKHISDDNKIKDMITTRFLKDFKSVSVESCLAGNAKEYSIRFQ